MRIKELKLNFTIVIYLLKELTDRTKALNTNHYLSFPTIIQQQSQIFLYNVIGYRILNEKNMYTIR